MFSTFPSLETVTKFSLNGKLSDEKSIFRFSNDLLCYGRLCEGQSPASLNGKVVDVSNQVRSENGITYLPFDAAEIVDNLRLERYTDSIVRQSILGTIIAYVEVYLQTVKRS